MTALHPRSARRLPLWTVLAAGLVAGCGNEFGIRDRGDDDASNTPVIRAEPEALAFPALTSRDLVTLSVTLGNVGQAVLLVDDILLTEDVPDGAGSYLVSAPSLPLEVARNESVSLDVTFQPVVGGDLPAGLTVVSNAGNLPELFVPITGIGQMPRVVIEPDPVDFGRINIPCEGEQTVVVRNLGPEPAVFTDISFGGDDADLIEVVTAVPDPLTVFENGQQLFGLQLTAGRKAVIDARFETESNDPRGTVGARVLAEASFISEESDTFAIPGKFPVDIVFAVDQSSSMSSVRTQLGNEFLSFIQSLEDASLNWKIGVVTHDRGASTGCFNGGAIVPVGDTNQWQTTFRNAVAQSGVSPADPYTEALLQLSDIALDKANATGCNATFAQGRNPLAPHPLHVIVVSDEKDQSAGPSDDAARAAQYVASYRAWAGQGAEVRVHGIIDLVDAYPFGSAGGVCNGPASQFGDKGYLDAIDQTGGIPINVCIASQWGPAFATITQDVIEGAQALKLSKPNPWEPSIRVYADGRALTEGWSYDPVRNAIIMDDPPRGKTVRVDYGVADARCL